MDRICLRNSNHQAIKMRWTNHTQAFYHQRLTITSSLTQSGRGGMVDTQDLKS